LEVDTNVLVKYTVTIFRAEVAILGSGEVYIGSVEEKTRGNESELMNEGNMV
jgi:hypothetical protein